jgi:hypothetical protein
MPEIKREGKVMIKGKGEKEWITHKLETKKKVLMEGKEGRRNNKRKRTE